MKFAISSCWNSHRHNDGYAMLVELAEMGFEYVELSHGTRMSLVPGILKAIAEGVIKVSSLHNFCPLPVGVMGAAPNLYEPAAASRRERVLWLNNTIKTIDFANRVDCDLVVLHSGSMRFLWSDPEEALDKAFKAAGGEDTGALKFAREKGLRKLKNKKKISMKRLRESFTLVADRARQAGVRFGIENREGFCELPLDSDMKGFLEELNEPEVFGYWHDSGHAQLKERMGILKHGEFLAELRPHLFGFHLHDVSMENRDHRIPGKGVIDWSIIADNVRQSDTVVIELSPSLSREDVLEGREFLTGAIPALNGK